MEFQVPQFIDQKPKIVGFLTLVQFLYLAGAAGISFLAFQIFNFFLWIFLSVIVFVVAAALAFVKVNGQDMIMLVRSAFSYFWQPKIYTWQREMAQQTIDVGNLNEIENIRSNMSIQDKLKSIALRVSTGKFFSRAENKTEGEYETVVYLTGERKQAKRVNY